MATNNNKEKLRDAFIVTPPSEGQGGGPMPLHRKVIK